MPKQTLFHPPNSNHKKIINTSPIKETRCQRAVKPSSLTKNVKNRSDQKKKLLSTPAKDERKGNLEPNYPGRSLFTAWVQDKIDYVLTRFPNRATKMKRSSPWADATMISLDDSSDSDSEEDNHRREKRSRSNGSFESFKDIMSEGTLIQTARMYQDYMKRIPIPTFSGSVVTFTSWQGLAESLKHLYKQPLHFLTNILVEQWDGQRFGSDEEHQPLDSVVHPLKAQTLIWLAEELHRLTSSPHHLAKLWASDPMYHSHIDPFLSY